MLRLMKTRPSKVGLAPGTLLYTGEKKVDKIRIRVMDYTPDELHEYEFDSIEDTFQFINTSSVSWINIDGLHDAAVVQAVGDHFKLHPLVLEDVMSPRQRAKFEDYEDRAFTVLRMLHYKEDTHEVEDEQLSLILGPNFVITFQERTGDIFEPVRERIRNGRGRVRKSDADYLAYALMDIIVDNYFVILEALGGNIQALDDRLMSDPTPELLQDLNHLKREFVFLRKSVWPLREVISGINRSESPLFTDSTQVFLRDVYDHSVQVIDTIEAYRDMVGGMFDTYLSNVSHRMNEVMQVLTIIATIFIPLTFVAGIYGMNFEFMPELKWHWAYPSALAVMVAIAAGMVVYFRRKKWF